MATIQGPWPPSSPREPGSLLPPHSIEAEIGVLGAMLLDNAVIPGVTEVLSGPEDFFRDDHQALYRAILGLHAAGLPADAVTAADAMGEDALAQAGGFDFLQEVCSVPHAA